MSIGDRVDRSLTVVLTVAAVVMATVVVARELRPTEQSRSDRDVGGPLPSEADWQRVLATSRPLGDTLGRLQLVEFSDLECPACRVFHTRTLPALMQSFGTNLTVRLVHFPLSSHRFAVPAARAAECAAHQRRFAEFVALVFAKPDSIGVKSWTAFARDAGVRDTTEFVGCLGNPKATVMVDSGRALAERLQIPGTPTILVNGWRTRGPSLTEVERVVSAFRAGKKPER